MILIAGTIHVLTRISKLDNRYLNNTITAHQANNMNNYSNNIKWNNRV
jgi:hypothetical protein